MALIDNRHAAIIALVLSRAIRSRRKYRHLMLAGAGALILSAPASAADWRITPSIAFDEVVTDNVSQTENDKRADAISQLAPSLNVTGEGQRGQVSLSYNPIFSAYVAEPSQDRVDQNLIGDGSIKVFDRLLTVDFNAFVNQGSGSGSFVAPTASGGLVPLNDRTTNYGGTIAPHLQARFGQAATLDAYYRVSSSNTTGNDQFATGLGGIDNSLLQQEEQVIIGSGDSFGQLSSQLNFDHTTGTGSGINNQFENDLDIAKFQYHLTHEYSLTGYAGYQRIHYDPTLGQQGYNNAGLTWSAGFEIDPNDFTTIQVSYGRQSGGYNLEAHVKYDLTPRTHFRADYTVAVENQLQSNLQNLQFLGHDAAGIPIDSRTGQGFNNADNELFGAQNSLFRDKIATASFTRDFTRSSVTASAVNERRQPLSGVSSPDNAWYGSVTYTRELTPYLRGNADIGYSVHSYGADAGGRQYTDKLINADVSLAYAINPTLTATAAYSVFRRNSTAQNNSGTTNQVMIGIRKEF